MMSSTGARAEGVDLPDAWYVVNDGVMGGLSQSSAARTADETLLFSGVVSFENNGGFASIRHAAKPFEINDGSGIRLKVKGDGKTYQLRVRTSDRFDGVAYRHDFPTADGEWRTIQLKWADFIPTFRGRKVPGAPALDAKEIEQIGFLIADKQEGSFALEIAAMDSM